MNKVTRNSTFRGGKRLVKNDFKIEEEEEKALNTKLIIAQFTSTKG